MPVRCPFYVISLGAFYGLPWFAQGDLLGLLSFCHEMLRMITGHEKENVFVCIYMYIHAHTQRTATSALNGPLVNLFLTAVLPRLVLTSIHTWSSVNIRMHGIQVYLGIKHPLSI